MPKLTEKERKEKQAEASGEKPKRAPSKKRRSTAIAPVFRPEEGVWGPEKRIRIRCPCCNMMPALEAFRSATPRIAIYEQSFGGRIAAPPGVKPGKKSKKAPGLMSYVDITDPASDIYHEISDIVKARVKSIEEIL